MVNKWKKKVPDYKQRIKKFKELAEAHKEERRKARINKGRE